jgi:hypothetical protein
MHLRTCPYSMCACELTSSSPGQVAIQRCLGGIERNTTCGSHGTIIALSWEVAVRLFCGRHPIHVGIAIGVELLWQ